MTGFGQVHPLPGIWDSFHLNTAVTLPIGVEAYAAYALRAWLSTGGTVSTPTRRFARWSAVGSLLLGMAGQIAYHLLAQARATHAPWGITTAVSCLPVLVLGMGAALAHLLRRDVQYLSEVDPAHFPDSGRPICQANNSGRHDDRTVVTFRRDQLAQAEASAARLIAARQYLGARFAPTAYAARTRIWVHWPASSGPIRHLLGGR
jgi:hypothetical protein